MATSGSPNGRTAANARIGRITPSGVVTEFPITTAESLAVAIVAGPGGVLWFSRSTSTDGKIGRITPMGAMSRIDLRAGTPAAALTFGPDGALWFTDFNGGAIGRVTVSAVPARRHSTNRIR